MFSDEVSEEVQGQNGCSVLTLTLYKASWRAAKLRTQEGRFPKRQPLRNPLGKTFPCMFVVWVRAACRLSWKCSSFRCWARWASVPSCSRGNGPCAFASRAAKPSHASCRSQKTKREAALTSRQMPTASTPKHEIQGISREDTEAFTALLDPLTSSSPRR